MFSWYLSDNVHEATYQTTICLERGDISDFIRFVKLLPQALGLSVLTRKTSKVISMTSQNKGVLAPKNASRFFYLDFASDWLGGWLEISEQRQKEEKEKNRNIFS